MGRIIKDFGYVEQVNDTVQCHASEIEKLKLVNLTYRISKDYKEKVILVKLHATAPEESTGFITITWSHEITNGSVEVDEMQFVESIFDAIVNYEGETWRQSDLIACYRNLNQVITEDLISKGYWIYYQDLKEWRNTPPE